MNWMRAIHIVLALSVMVLGLNVIGLKKDRDYYQDESSQLRAMKDNVIVCKYFATNGDVRSYLYKLALGESYMVDFLPEPKTKLVRVSLFMGIRSDMPDMPIEKSTPWDSLSIQDKMFLCAYGSSGNKLNREDLKEITERYGAK
jgi:hypothetical protein